eukprot:GDKK01034095.1.p1 GENE.GDKK01034095.1~~GDKK01034095.1.p1  ORF type:complete len:105 (+),score=2.90 GDKK01034095.1:53-367(+)
MCMLLSNVSSYARKGFRDRIRIDWNNFCTQLNGCKNFPPQLSSIYRSVYIHQHLCCIAHYLLASNKINRILRRITFSQLSSQDITFSAPSFRYINSCSTSSTFI